MFRLSLPALALLSSGLALAQADLTGAWTANDGGVYYVRQAGKLLFWAGFSADTPDGSGDFHKGLRFTNVFFGSVSGSTASGDWANVPRGQVLNSGTLKLNVSSNFMETVTATGGFTAGAWHRAATAPPPEEIFTLFNRVMKNQNSWRDHSLLDDLKPAKPRAVAVFGNLAPIPGDLKAVRTGDAPFQKVVFVQQPPDPDPMHVNYSARSGRTYHDFICLNGNDSPPDADLDFEIQVDRAALDNQFGFWVGDWETSHGITPSNFRNKLNVHNLLHPEAIMYGGTKECGDDGAPSFPLPGWEQPGGGSVLFNGRPIAGQMDLTDRDSKSSRVNNILGHVFRFGDRLRVTGALAIDCGHGIEHDCHEDDGSFQNQEIHPVYAIDAVQDFRLPRPFASLTGVWASDDSGTYYVSQIGNTVWWLGMSADEGRSFANVFKGSVQNGVLTGVWADIPLGPASGLGTATVQGATAISTKWNRTSPTDGLLADSWQKLRDAGGRRVVVIFENAEMSSAFWPGTDSGGVTATEPFELSVGGINIEAAASNVRLVKTPDGREVMRADLGARIPVDLPAAGPLRIAAQFSGYRSAWPLPEAEWDSAGERSQDMTTPASLRVAAPARAGAPMVPQSSAAPTPISLPRLTIHYRIEVTPNF